MNKDRAKQLSREHWAYIRRLLKAHKLSAFIIKLIGFHYRTAFIHGYKHAIEDYLEDVKKEER